TFRIARRFNGPHDSGNGGYAGGPAAQLLGPHALKTGAAEVTRRAPIPLEQTLRAPKTHRGLAIMTDDAATRIPIMSARPTHAARPAVRSPPVEAAKAATATFRSVEDPALRHYFACGPARAPGDGRRLFPDWLKEPSGLDNPNHLPPVAPPCQ